MSQERRGPESAWFFDALAVTSTELVFVDPAQDPLPDEREHGVRVEIRELRHDPAGSVYASPSIRLAPALCRVDLFETAAGAADRMHWHPRMADGEPCDRVFDPLLAADPLGWLETLLGDLDGVLRRHGATARPEAADAAELARSAPAIVEHVGRQLAVARGTL